MSENMLNLGAILPSEPEPKVLIGEKEYAIKINVLAWIKYLKYINIKDPKKIEDKDVLEFASKIDPLDILQSALPDFDFEKNRLSQKQVMQLFFFIIKLIIKEFQLGQGEIDLKEQESKKNDTQIQ